MHCLPLLKQLQTLRWLDVKYNYCSLPFLLELHKWLHMYISSGFAIILFAYTASNFHQVAKFGMQCAYAYIPFSMSNQSSIKLMCQCDRNLLVFGIVMSTDLTVQRSLVTYFVKGVLSLTTKQLIMFGTQIM